MTLTIFIPVAIGLLFAEFSGIPQSIMRWLAKKGYGVSKVNGFALAKLIPYRCKPFDCGMCLTFWVALAINYFLSKFTLLDAFGFSCMSACVAYLITSIHARINR